MDTRTPTIVVGVDETAGSRAALRFAVEEALSRGAVVDVLSAWIWQSPYEGFTAPAGSEESERETEQMQDALVREVLAEFERTPELRRTIVNAYAGEALVERAEDALMLVVGSGRKGALSRAIIGSVSEFCVRHSTTPVVVVPDPDRIRAHHEHAAAERV